MDLFDKETVCCFTGHRKIPIGNMEFMLKKLKVEIKKLIQQGVTSFICGGAYVK